MSGTTPQQNRIGYIFLGGIIVLCLVGWGITRALPVDTTPKADVGDQVGAWLVCKDFVTARLKSPSTAAFPANYTSDGVTITPFGSGLFRVNSYVDAENSYGAKLRMSYECNARYTGKTTWKLESLNMQ